jgi:hypothetical protein
MRRLRALPSRRALARSSRFPASEACTTDTRGQHDRVARLFATTGYVAVTKLTK